MDGPENTPKGNPQRPDYKGKLEACVAGAVEAATSTSGTLETSRGASRRTLIETHHLGEQAVFTGKVGRKTLEGLVWGPEGHDATEFELTVKDVGLINSLVDKIDTIIPPAMLVSGGESNRENYGAGTVRGHIRDGKVAYVYSGTDTNGDGPLSNQVQADAGLKQVSAMEKRVEACMSSPGKPQSPKRQFKPVGP